MRSSLILLLSSILLSAVTLGYTQEADTEDTGDTAPVVQPVTPQESSGAVTEQQLLNRIQANPKDKNAYDSLIRLYFNKARHADRIRIVSQAIKNLGENADYYMIIGDEYKTLQDYPKAVIAYQKAIEIEPRNAVFYNRLGLAQLKLSFFHQAEASFKAATFYSGNASRKAKGIYINNLGVTFEARQEYQEAAKYFKLCLSYHPTYDNAISNLERVTEMLKKQGTE